MTRKPKAIYQLKVTLRDIEPPIWRRILVPDDTKLPRLHKILQLLFNWEDYHLHSFVAGRRTYSVPDPEDQFLTYEITDERRIPLSLIADHVGASFDYLYDFGDDWRHDILLEAILLAEPDAFYPQCIAGSRNGPPEDVGGPFGYQNYLEALANPSHEQHEELLAWRGPFKPEAFSLKKINTSLASKFRPRRK